MSSSSTPKRRSAFGGITPVPEALTLSVQPQQLHTRRREKTAIVHVTYPVAEKMLSTLEYGQVAEMYLLHAVIGCAVSGARSGTYERLRDAAGHPAALRVGVKGGPVRSVPSTQQTRARLQTETPGRPRSPRAVAGAVRCHRCRQLAPHRENPPFCGLLVYMLCDTHHEAHVTPGYGRTTVLASSGALRSTSASAPWKSACTHLATATQARCPSRRRRWPCSQKRP